MSDQTEIEVKQALIKITDQVKEAGEKAMAEAAKGVVASHEQKARIDELLVKFGGLTAQVAELEQKAVRRPGGDDGDDMKSAGDRVIDSDAFKGMKASGAKSIRVGMERKDLMNVTATTGTGASPGNSLVGSQRIGGIIARPNRKMTISSSRMGGQTTEGSVEFVVETGFTNNAGMQAEGATKAKSDIKFDLKSVPVRTIAHIFKTSRQMMDDAKGLASYIDGRARYGLELKEEQQLLSGDGTGANILGILPQASAFAPAINISGATAIDRMRLALLQSVLAEYPGSGFVFNPIDWAGIELTKDGEGRYLIANPMNSGEARLWGLPVVETQAMAVGKFLTGAFNMAAQIYDRMEIEVLLSTENVNDFETNMLTIRAESRLALAVYRPEAFVTGSIAATV
jgi:HK97 family phage major capsid protein